MGNERFMSWDLSREIEPELMLAGSSLKSWGAAFEEMQRINAHSRRHLWNPWPLRDVEAIEVLSVLLS